MNRLRFVPALLALLVATGCSGGSQPGDTQPADRESLHPEEWSGRTFYSAADVVASLRPLWLTKRGQDGEVQVYVDEVHLGGIEMLRSVRVASISLIRHLDGIQASARYGIGHSQGAILVSTRAAAR
jgi:hypothetical protein